jgi:predicted esterase
MTRAFVLSLLLASFGVAQDPKDGLSSKETAEAKELIKQYFAAKTWDEKRAVVEKLEAIDHPSKGDIAALARVCFQHAARGPLVDTKPKQRCTDPAYPGEYILQAPSSARQKKTGVFISLHGGGDGVGEGSQIQGLFGTPGPGMINVYPTVVQKTGTAWNTEREEQYVLAILDELKRSFQVDTNHVYLAGHSMGGFGTWSIGGRHADLFAAVSPMAGGTFGGGVIPNLKNTPIWVYHSTDDAQVGAESDVKAAEQLAKMKEKYGPFEFVWKLYNDIGHGLPKDGVKPIFDWMLKKTRNPFPKHVVWEGSRPYKRFFYWLKKERPGGLVEAKLDGQTVALTGSTAGLEVLLSEKMLKFGEPVVVTADGKEVHNGKVKYSLVALVESIAAKNDPEMYFVARVRVP